MSSTQQNEYQKFPHHGPKSYFEKFSQGLQWSNPAGQSLTPQQSVLLYGPQSKNLKASTQKTPKSLPLIPWEVEQSKNTSQVVDNMKGPPIYDSNVRTIIPPPPAKHNQRQQFFQQQQALGSSQSTHGYSESTHDELISRTQNISTHDGTYNDAYPQQSLTSSKQVKPEDELFEDLVDFAKAKSKTSPSKSGSY